MAPPRDARADAAASPGRAAADERTDGAGAGLGEQATDELPVALAAIAEASRPTPAGEPTGAPLGGDPAPAAVFFAPVRAVTDAGVEIDLGVSVKQAQRGHGLHRAVLETACETGEPVLVSREPSGYVVRGALRTQPTAGIDQIDELKIEARRIELSASEEVQVRSGIAIIAVRAIGEVETYADRIVSRAEEVQKLVARMLRLN